jgi:spore germination protein KC
MRYLVRILTALLLLTSLAGCWDNRPIDQRDLVLLIGIGPGPHNQVTVYFQIPTPAALSSLTGGAGGTGANAGTTVLEGSGPSLGAAIEQAQGTTSRDIYLGQIQMVMFSTRLDPTQMLQLVGEIARMGVLDKTAYAAVTPIPLAKLLDYQPKQTRVAPLYFLSLFTCPYCQTVKLGRTLWTLERRAVTPGISMYLPLVTLGTSGFIVNRIAAYDHYRLALTLTPAETVALGFVLGITQKATVQTSTPMGPVAVRGLSAQPSTGATLHGNHLALSVHLAVSGTLDYLPASEATPAHLALVDRLISRQIAHQVLHVLTLLKHSGSDPVGFGQALLWQDPPLRSAWPRLYRTASLSVDVQTTIQNLGDAT